MRGIGRWLLGVSLMFGIVTAPAEVPIASFARHAKYKDAKISPNGDYLAVTGIVDDKTMLGLVRLSDMHVVNISPRSREDISEFWWVAPDRVMYTVNVHFGSIVNPQGTGELFTVKADGTESNAIFGLRVSGDRLPTSTHLQMPSSDRATGELITALRDDPGHALIASYPWLGTGSAADVNPIVYKIDLREGNKVQVASSPLPGARFLADHKGVVRMYYGRGSDANFVGKIYYRDSSEGKWTQVAGGDGLGSFLPIQFDRTNESVYAHCNGSQSICKWNGKTHKLETLWTSKDGASGYLIQTFDGLDAFAVRTYGGRPATALLDKNAPEAALLISMIKQFPGVDVRIASASLDGKKVVLLASGSDDPGVFYLYDAETKKTTKLLERMPWIKPGQMAQAEAISLKARDGLDLHGYLTRPPGKEQAKNLPMIVMVHGGPYGIFDTWDFEREVQLLATHGYAVLQVNFRGSGGYGSEFVKAGYREWGGKMQDDVTDATHWAIDQGVADAGRICIYGVSYGGYAALQGVSKEPDLYRCAIGNSGVYDLRLWSGHSDLVGSGSAEEYLGKALGKDDADLAARSPISYAERIRAKVMLIVGGADERVPKAQGENMRRALQKSGNDPEWVYERTEGHGFYDEKHVADLYEKMLSFLDQNIGSGYKTASAK